MSSFISCCGEKKIPKSSKSCGCLSKVDVSDFTTEDTILSSDHIVDVGPGAGEAGGEIIYSGKPDGIEKIKNSYTGKYISREMEIAVPKKRTKINDEKIIKIFKAHKNNLKNINVEIPIGLLTCITGVSGSGKSTIAKSLYSKLMEIGSRPVTLLDGDIVRTHLSSELGFSKEHRNLNIKRIFSQNICHISI